MKNFLLFIAAMLCYVASAAQTESKHMTFKGVPIDGTLEECVSRLEKVGFTHLWTDDGTAMLQGDFAGYKECKIDVFTCSNSKVYGIGIEFPIQNDWTSLEANYQHLKNMLIAKYNKPFECTEGFQGDISPKDNIDKLLRLKRGECTYKTSFITSDGYVILTLGHNDLGACGVVLLYADGVNAIDMFANTIIDL